MIMVMMTKNNGERGIDTRNWITIIINGEKQIWIEISIDVKIGSKSGIKIRINGEIASDVDGQKWS